MNTQYMNVVRLAYSMTDRKMHLKKFKLFPQRHPPFKETILIADDSDWDRKLMAMALTSLGYKVLEARNGHEGLQMIQNHFSKIDLILTDILMAEMDGVEFIQRVRAQLPQMKVVFISGYKRRFMQRIGSQRVDFIDKSLDVLRLAKKVRKTLDYKSPLTRWISKVVSRDDSF